MFMEPFEPFEPFTLNPYSLAGQFDTSLADDLTRSPLFTASRLPRPGA